VERGDYATTSEVIRTALREWELKEELRRLEGERIAKLWDEGLASGPAVEGPPIMGLLRAEYAEMERADEEKAGQREKGKNGRKRSRKVA
jgi:antitoxin ParD1/3/4